MIQVTPESVNVLPAADKPKRARKPRGKAKAPATPRPAPKPRAKPRTLRARIDDLGPCHLEAFERARKRGGESYEESVRAALDARDRLVAAKARNAAARMALAEAATALVEAEEVAEYGQPILDRLALAAKTLAGLDAPDVEPDAQPTADEPHIDEASFLKP